MVGILLQIVKLQFCLLIFLRAGLNVDINFLCNLEQIVQPIWTSVSSSLQRKGEREGEGEGEGEGGGTGEGVRREKDWMT